MMTTAEAVKIARRINDHEVCGLRSARVLTVTVPDTGTRHRAVRVTTTTGAVRLVASVDAYTALANEVRR